MSKSTDLYPAVNALFQEYTVMRTKLVKWWKNLSDGDQITLKTYYLRRVNFLDEEIDKLAMLLDTTYDHE